MSSALLLLRVTLYIVTVLFPFELKAVCLHLCSILLSEEEEVIG